MTPKQKDQSCAGAVSTLKAAPDHCNDETVELLRTLLADAQSGDLVALTGVAEYRGGTYAHIGSSTMSRLQTSGALLEAAVKRLGFED